ncbi:MAG TPA: hypothetical protein VGL76_08120 [Gaiellaceae bacterium]
MRRLRRTTDSLTRGELVALSLAGLTVAGVVVLVGVFASGWWRGTGGTYVPSRLTTTSRITPQSSLFADPLVAEIDVVLDARSVDPATVQLTPSFRPFVVRSQSRSVERGVGAATIVRFRYEIECVAATCVPLLGKKKGGGIASDAITLPAAKLLAGRRNGTTLSRTVAWPPFTVHSRLTSEEAGLSTPHFAPWFTPPPISWRLSPDLVGGLALSVAVVLLLGAGLLVATVAVGDTARLRVRRVSHLSPVERALRLAEHAAASGELDEERKALQRLAVELGQTGYGELADQARWLAWSEDDPSSDGLESLAHALRSNGAR